MDTTTEMLPATKEYLAGLLRDALNALYAVDNFDVMRCAYSDEDVAKLKEAIHCVLELRSQLTIDLALPVWFDAWGQKRQWLYPPAAPSIPSQTE